MLNSRNNIIIFSKAIQTGKTTALFNLIKKYEHVGGFLTPDVNGKRMLYDIEHDKYHEFETKDDVAHPTQKIGKFTFVEKAFDKAKNIINQYNNEALMIIDEVGKLELEMDKGFEPMVKKIIVDFKIKKFDGILLLVIRDTLLEKAIEKYGLQEAEIVEEL